MITIKTISLQSDAEKTIREFTTLKGISFSKFVVDCALEKIKNY